MSEVNPNCVLCQGTGHFLEEYCPDCEQWSEVRAQLADCQKERDEYRIMLKKNTDTLWNYGIKTRAREVDALLAKYEVTK